MKISYNTNPVLSFLSNKSWSIQVEQNTIANTPIMIDGIKEMFKRYDGGLKNNIIKISPSFYDAAMLSRDKMFANSLYDELEDLLEGVLIWEDNTIVYHAERIREENCWLTKILIFVRKNFLRTFYGCGIRYSYVDAPSETPESVAEDGWRLVQIMLLFKKFAQVEIKELPPNKRVKDINYKYINETDLHITHLTSAWFTTLVKSDAFKVRGHFRLQPKKKDGKWTRELIWINDFEKSGYTAPARKLNHNETIKELTQ
tara:strand:+ start:323 stop:1096 length:774 start_codon:yes stop_codon:yes gene_type:complete